MRILRAIIAYFECVSVVIEVACKLKAASDLASQFENPLGRKEGQGQANYYLARTTWTFPAEPTIWVVFFYASF